MQQPFSSHAISLQMTGVLLYFIETMTIKVSSLFRQCVGRGFEKVSAIHNFIRTGFILGSNNWFMQKLHMNLLLLTWDTRKNEIMVIWMIKH